MLINLNEFINHNTTVNISLATTQTMADSPECPPVRVLMSRGRGALHLHLPCLPETWWLSHSFLVPLPPVLVTNNV